MAETSLVFNLIAKDKATAALESMKTRFADASAAIGTGVAAALGYGITQSLNMGAASDKLAAQLGAGPAKAAELSKVAAKTFEAGWGDSFDTVNLAIKGVVQNIGDVSKSAGGMQGVTQKVLALSQTFDQDLGGTTAAVGQLLKTGLARNADEALDILTKGFQSGANKADDLLDTFTEYGTQFRKFGLDGATATGLLSQGLKAGARDADTVADALKEFSIRAVDGSKTSVAGYEALGLSANKMAAQIAKGGPAAKQGLDTVLDRLRAVKDPLKQSQIAVQLFGTKAEDLGQALFKLDPSSAVKALGNVSGAADKMAKTLHDNPAAALEKFKRTATAKLAEVGGGIVQWAMQNQNIVQPLAIGLGVVAAAMVAVRIAQAAWTTIQVVATAAQWAYNAALSANPIGLIIIAVIALVAGIVLLWKKNETFRKVVTAAWQAIWGVVKAVGKWFANTLWPWMKGAFSKIGSGASAVWNAISTWFGKILSWTRALPGRIGRFFGNAGKLLWNKGKDIVSGLWNGIKSMASWIKDKLIGFAKAVIPGPIAKALGIDSPSKVTAALGRWAAIGLAQGVMSGTDRVIKVSKAQARWVARSLVDGLTGSKSQITTAGRKLLDMVKDGMAKGSRKNALIDRIKGDTAMLKILAGQQTYFAKQLEKATDKLKNLRSARADLIKSIKDGIVSAADLTSGVKDGENPTVSGILGKLTADAQAARKFADDLERLRKKGLDKDLLSSLAQKGVEGAGATVATLASASAADIRAINSQQAALESAAQRAGTTAGDAMYAAGIKAAEGLVKGLEKQQKKVEAAMLRIAKALEKAIRKALKIKSPSGLMAEVGQWIPPGLLEGVKRTSPAMEVGLGQWASDAVTTAVKVPQVRPAAPVIAAAGRGGGQGGTTRIVVDLASAPAEVKRLLRKIVRVDGGGNVQLAFGERGA